MVTEEQSTDSHVTTDRQTPGQMLREAREKQGISQQDIADKLFLKVKHVDDMESDRIDETMSITFAKGYVRNYAKNVGIDDKAVIQEFERMHGAPKPPAKLQSFSRRVAKQAHDDRWMMVTYVIFFLLLAGVVVWWYQQSDDEPMASEATESAAEQTTLSEPLTENTQNEAFQNPPGPNNQTLPEQADGDSDVDAGLSDDEASQADNATRGEEASEQAREDATSVDITEVEEAAPESISVAPGAADTDAMEPVEVVFTFGEDCWVNIEDATGEAIAYGVKTAGRVMRVSGKPPFDVTLGAPQQVKIEYNGEPVDTSFLPENSTARFTLPLQD